MMHSFIPFLQMFLLLLIGGTALALILLPKATMSLAMALGIPLGALLNVGLIFLYTVAGIPLTQISIVTGHLGIIAVLFVIIYRKPILLMDLERVSHAPKVALTRIQIFVMTLSGIIIAASMIYSFSHAVLLPSTQYDSMTNWTMRSQISFIDQRIAFDPTEVRGMAKPQYPFLFHALQISANQGQRHWSDAAANGILYILSLASFGAVFLIVRKLRGLAHGLATLAAILAMPLLTMHLAQGYGDVNLLQYFLLSIACLGMWIESTHVRRNRWLVLSAVFIAASVWTKSEGSVFGLLPWLLTVALICGKNKLSWKKAALPAMIVAVVLSLPWPIYAALTGLSLTPHSSDTLLQFHPEAVKEVLRGMFGRGSFGITWYALLLLVPTVAVAGWKKHPDVVRAHLPLLVWGTVMLLEVLFIYLCTPNVRFLLNAESFYRQMMIPAAMLILACAFCLHIQRKADH